MWLDGRAALFKFDGLGRFYAGDVGCGEEERDEADEERAGTYGEECPGVEGDGHTVHAVVLAVEVYDLELFLQSRETQLCTD